MTPIGKLQSKNVLSSLPAMKQKLPSPLHCARLDVLNFGRVCGLERFAAIPLAATHGKAFEFSTSEHGLADRQVNAVGIEPLLVFCTQLCFFGGPVVTAYDHLRT